jgi:hypothetical protein
MRSRPRLPCFALPASATPVSFTFSGVGAFDSSHTATGSFVIDDSLFNGGASQYLQNSNITQLSFTTTSSLGTTSFGFADIVTSDGAFYDSSNTPTSIVNGSGFLVSKNGLVLSINGASQVSPFDNIANRPLNFIREAGRKVRSRQLRSRAHCGKPVPA